MPKKISLTPVKTLKARAAEEGAELLEHLGAEGKPTKVHRAARAEALHAGTVREVYLAEYRAGATVGEISRKHGVSRQAVSQSIHGREKFLARQRKRDAVRKAPTIRKRKICSACGLRGHQYNSPKFHPENSKAA